MFVIVCWLCLLLCGVVFVIVIFVWLFKFNNVVWDKIGEVGTSSGVVCANLRLVH